jgi:hypothetical protein
MTYALHQRFSRRGMNRPSLGNDASDESAFVTRRSVRCSPTGGLTPGAELLSERDVNFNADTYIGHTLV